MGDFASFVPSGKKSDEEWKKEAEDIVRAYGGKGESEILKAIYARAVEGKKAGTLTNEQIDLFYAQFAPMLDGVKRKRLQKLVAELKKL